MSAVSIVPCYPWPATMQYVKMNMAKEKVDSFVPSSRIPDLTRRYLVAKSRKQDNVPGPCSEQTSLPGPLRRATWRSHCRLGPRLSLSRSLAQSVGRVMERRIEKYERREVPFVLFSFSYTPGDMSLHFSQIYLHLLYISPLGHHCSSALCVQYKGTIT